MALWPGERRRDTLAAIPDEGIRRQLTQRDVTYMLGEFDTLPVYGFDVWLMPGDGAGPNRLARGITYWNYLKSKYRRSTSSS